jgi:hypothetical protein
MILIHRFITLSVEEATFRSIFLAKRLHVIFPGTVLDTVATKHVGADTTVILAHLDKYFLMHPAIGPPVTMPDVMLGHPFPSPPPEQPCLRFLRERWPARASSLPAAHLVHLDSL